MVNPNSASNTHNKKITKGLKTTAGMAALAVVLYGSDKFVEASLNTAETPKGVVVEATLSPDQLQRIDDLAKNRIVLDLNAIAAAGNTSVGLQLDSKNTTSGMTTEDLTTITVDQATDGRSVVTLSDLTSSTTGKISASSGLLLKVDVPQIKDDIYGLSTTVAATQIKDALASSSSTLESYGVYGTVPGTNITTSREGSILSVDATQATQLYNNQPLIDLTDGHTVSGDQIAAFVTGQLSPSE